MPNPARIRCVFILVAFAIGAGVTFWFSKPVCFVGNFVPNSILEQVLNNHKTDARFDFGVCLARTMVIMLPVVLLFLVIDLRVLRKAPVQYLGCFAVYLGAIALNVIISFGVWISVGGWSPPVSWPIIVTVFVLASVLATVSEARIFASFRR